jgi:hypothetical protein
MSGLPLQSSIAYRGGESTTGNKVHPTIRHVCILQSYTLHCGMWGCCHSGMADIAGDLIFKVSGGRKCTPLGMSGVSFDVSNGL